MEIIVREEPEAVAALAAATIGAWLAEEDGAATIGLAGGSTPRATYRRLRAEPVAWDRVTGWLADERWVPADHPDSNGRMARDTLFDHVPARLLEPAYGLGDATAAAAAYERELARAFDSAPDVVLLGMGDDGHTASLFPGTDALQERHRWYAANWVPAQGAWRVTATLPLLAAARRVAFLVTGAAKADRLAAILDHGADLPAGLVARAAADVTWFLDAPAASRLQGA